MIGPIKGYVPPPLGMMRAEVVAVLEASHKTHTRVAKKLLCTDEVRTGEVKERPYDGERWMAALQRENQRLLKEKKLLELRQLLEELLADL